MRAGHGESARRSPTRECSPQRRATRGAPAFLEWDQALGRAVFILGVVLYGTALVMGWTVLYPRPR